MADAVTATGSVGTDLVAYDRLSYFPMRAELYADRFADVRSTSQTNVGNSVTFQKWTELAAATTPLSESVDVDAVAISDAQVAVAMAEYGNAVLTTKRLRATSFIPINPVVANLLGYNAGLSIDTIAMAIIAAGTNVRYGSGDGSAPANRAAVAATDTLAGADVRRALAELRGANIQTFDGNYAAFIHPDVSFDLRGTTGAGSWRDPHVYSQPANIWNGEIGVFENFRFVEAPRAPMFTDAGAGSTVDVYRTLFMGRQALAKAHSNAEGYGPAPRIVKGAVVDKLGRFQPIGWLHLVGYGIFRQESLRAVESASTIGANT